MTWLVTLVFICYQRAASRLASELDRVPPSAFSPTIEFCLWVVISLLVFQFSQMINLAASQSTRGVHRPNPWLPIATTLIFSGQVAFIHWYAWVPVLLAAAISAPIVILPPLSYRIYEHQHRPPRQNGAARPGQSALYTFQEASRIRDKAALSQMVRDFCKRYPHARIYVFRQDNAYTCGGLLLHNREPLPIPTPTFIEVTLECPFTNKPGILAEGREQFSAYLGRHHPRGSTIIPLPQTDWSTWVQGMKSREWMEFIQQVDESDMTHDPVGDKPVQLGTRYSRWERFSLD